VGELGCRGRGGDVGTGGRGERGRWGEEEGESTGAGVSGGGICAGHHHQALGGTDGGEGREGREFGVGREGYA
jgi:hypothetical protein